MTRTPETHKYAATRWECSNIGQLVATKLLPLNARLRSVLIDRVVDALDSRCGVAVLVRTTWDGTVIRYDH